MVDYDGQKRGKTHRRIVDYVDTVPQCPGDPREQGHRLLQGVCLVALLCRQGAFLCSFDLFRSNEEMKTHT